tara:strand:- start:25 stop:720 length:696 start_codon:yes stop_codon:yes gene_type:complete
MKKYCLRFLAKRLTEIEKNEMMTLFINGQGLDFLMNKFEVSKLTIIRNLKKLLGENEYKNFLNKNLKSNKKKNSKVKVNKQNDIRRNNSYSNIKEDKSSFDSDIKDSSLEQPFIEITPLIQEISSDMQKDLSSIPISSMCFPKILYMTVDKNFELEIKLLKDYLDWNFLPQEDLSRKTIEVFLDIKEAKIKCNKDQKVIKIPNTKVFQIVNHILLSKGISRIVCGNNLVAL